MSEEGKAGEIRTKKGASETDHPHNVKTTVEANVQKVTIVKAPQGLKPNKAYEEVRKGVRGKTA